METVLVTAVSPYTPDDECAEVTLLGPQGKEIVAFCHLYSLRVGDKVPNRLSVLNGEVRAAYLSDWSEDVKASLSLERLERISAYAYRGCGRVVDQAEGLVEVFGFVIDFGEVPCDGTVEFEIERLDV